MDLPDCPPGAEGYEDTVTELPKKLDDPCTKVEQQFLGHLNSLKITLENGEQRPMVERCERNPAGMWTYLCFPCAATCSGENMFQSHLSGKKHKSKLELHSTWPRSIREDHPFYQNKKKSAAMTPQHSQRVLPKLQAEVNDKVILRDDTSSAAADAKLAVYRNQTCHIKETMDKLKPIVGLEYLVEHPPEQPHHEPSYICTLCMKKGHPRTIVNHMTCFQHNANYVRLHFTKASYLMANHRVLTGPRSAVNIVMMRLVKRIEDTYGRMQPLLIEKAEFDKRQDELIQCIYRGSHYTEKDGATFEEVIDVNLIDSLMKSDNDFEKQSKESMENYSSRSKPYPDKNAVASWRNSRAADKSSDSIASNKMKPNYEYKRHLVKGKVASIEKAAKKTLEYHEKNPEKHPLYPEEWKKFWNKRYKEIQAEGKDPSKHDFKPEWIVYWTKRMKELHDEELRAHVNEICRKYAFSPPPENTKSMAEKRRSPEQKQRSPDRKLRSPDRKLRSPDRKLRSPDRKLRSPMRRSLNERRRTPDYKRQALSKYRPSDSKQWSPEHRRRSPVWDLLPDRRRSPDMGRDFTRDTRSPGIRRSPGRRSPVGRSYGARSPERRLPVRRTSRSPNRHARLRSRSPRDWRRSPSGGVRFQVHSDRSNSPLSRRDDALPLRNRSPELAPSMQTVLVSDDDLDSDVGSLTSFGDHISRADSVRSHTSRSRRDTVEKPDDRDEITAPVDLGPPENVVATLRLLVALEDYLGSFGPKIVDLLTEALKMEKEKANSSEQLLECESAVVLMETTKEKLKGAIQAGLVNGSAAVSAVRSAVVRVAATLHVADERVRRADKTETPSKQMVSKSAKAAAVPVAGIGEVDRAQIAQQMAEALIAQGKTDVTAEELSQLVDAVVGMAEAKKMETQKQITVQQRPTEIHKPSNKMSGTASALQMLQSAYDENEKKIEKAEVPDAMDGLSDSDLETLLKNFNELSAEEQHSLIAYLKKLEAREPQRVERLRQYVNATEPVPLLEELPQMEDVKPESIHSDDDDYTVDEVFQSATLKVKEDQIRQEMEIVKKSLEESKVSEPIKSPASIQTVDLTKSISSATDILALVQASIQSVAKVPAPVTSTADVVTTNSQPKSFGDLPEPNVQGNPGRQTIQNLIQVNTPAPVRPNVFNQQPSNPQPLRPPSSLLNFGSNMNTPNINQNTNTPYNQNSNTPSYNQTSDTPNYNQNLITPNYNQTSNTPNYNQNSNTPNYNQNLITPNYNQNSNTPNYNQNSNTPNYNQTSNTPNYNQTSNTPNYNLNSNTPNYNQDSTVPNYNQNANAPSYNQPSPWNQRPMNQNSGQNTVSHMPNYDNYNQHQGQQYNQDPRGNFMNGRQNNYEVRQPDMNQQYGNYQEQQNYRGRGGGRGTYGGPNRGRGRGYY